MKTILQHIANELEVDEKQISVAVELLDGGSTVPFIARYRKDLTGGLDDVQLRTLEDKLQYFRGLEERREVILKSIKEQGKLTEELRRSILEVESKTELEDLYIPYKPKRRTKGQIAREAGLKPLAYALLSDHELHPETEALKYINTEKSINTEQEALDGACYILMEKFSENAKLLARLKTELWENGIIYSCLVVDEAEANKEALKFKDYFHFQENFKTLPSHRALAIFRGSREGVLRCGIQLESESNDGDGRKEYGVCEQMVADFFNIYHQGKPADDWLKKVVRWSWRVKLRNQIETELLGLLRDRAEEEGIAVFAKNLKDLLMAPPAGSKVTLGLDPGFRAGVKICVVDKIGKLVDYTTTFPHPPQKKWKESLEVLATLCLKHSVEIISIGNGTASRETTKLIAELISNYPKLDLVKVIVNEAGASVYSASELATKEFPDLDVLFRGAVSIARRLQDPLAELVKIDPKSIGVGQYQHDVNQVRLSRALDHTVEDCVNAVGVDVNSASSALLARVSGLNRALAENIVAYRYKNGQFDSRESLKNVEQFGEKTFEQAAGFLRITEGSNALDASAVHPEAYSVVEKIAKSNLCDVRSLIGKRNLLAQLDLEKFIDGRFGILTIRDILSELEKPGRDPRPEFVNVSFKEDVDSINDLKKNMELEGVVTNVTDFGAFVDVGVHQDGLVHISSMSNQFVKNPRDIVKVGEIIKVRVIEVDINRSRINLTMKKEIEKIIGNLTKVNEKKPNKKNYSEKQKGRISQKKKEVSKTLISGVFARAFSQAKELRK